MTDSRSGSRSFDSKLISLLPLDEVPVHVHRFAARVPCDSKGSECQCGIHTAETSTSSRSLNSNSSAAITFFAWHPNSPPRPGEAPHPAPSARKSATQTAQKTALCAPWEHPGGFGIRKSASNSGHSPLRGLGGGLGGGLGDASPARRGSRSRPPLRRPRPLRFARLRVQCGIHTAEAASALRSRKTERAAKEKPTPISQFFLAPAAPWHPNSPPRPGEAPHPAPSARKSATRTAQKTALCAPCEHPGGFGIRKSASNSGHSPLRGSG